MRTNLGENTPTHWWRQGVPSGLQDMRGQLPSLDEGTKALTDILPGHHHPPSH